MLDPRGRKGLMRVCRELHDRGMTVVMIRRTKHAKANPDLYKPRKLRSKKKEDAQLEEA